MDWWSGFGNLTHDIRAAKLLNTNLRNKESTQTVVLTDKLIQELQITLNEKGFNAGIVDGIYGAQTRDAIIKAQKFLKIPVDGIASEGLLNVLRQLSRTSVNNSVVNSTLGYVAVYISQTGAFGYSYHHDSEASANDSALKECRAVAGVENCFLILNKFMPKCVTVARGNGGIGAAAESGLSLTRSNAIRACQNYDSSPSTCKVVNEYCASN
jgi:hypothetical protein